MKKQKRKLYDVISPDGFTIRISVPLFRSIEQRNEYFNMWKDRYKIQGYYSSVHFGHINLLDLADFCEWIEGTSEADIRSKVVGPLSKAKLGRALPATIRAIHTAQKSSERIPLDNFGKFSPNRKNKK